MNYIINPSWFYWISVADAVKTILIVSLIASLAICLILAILYLIHKSAGVGCGKDDYDNIAAKNLIKPIKISLGFAIIFSVAVIFSPSRNTLIEMQIARFATYENAEWTIDKIKEVVDYVINAVQNAK